MFRIIKREQLNSTVVLLDIEAPLVANKAKAGQFIILRVDEDGERIPLTVAGCDADKGSVTVIFQIVGATTKKLSLKNEGEYISDFVGPLGTPTKIKGLKKVCVIGGGVGCAIALPVAKALKEEGAEVTSVIGFRNKDIVILEDKFKAISDNLYVMTDDGSYGQKGNVCIPLQKLLDDGERFDEVFAIGPLIMMKFVTQTVKPYNIPCTVSMNPVMVDGTGMCGGCRITLNKNGQKVTSFACVDGPDFNAYEIDFDQALQRGSMYGDFERHAYEETCNLFKKEVE
ncbi:MAG: sulfide/dihydroorotate dehydrogenase-like FAD/NAD-binding protein [Clostridia bacterium]|nr:sulfide/dihydroorotate dehydrogenase-like FAD/NAD-binding protein [Clostridia bacterium]